VHIAKGWFLIEQQTLDAENSLIYRATVSKVDGTRNRASGQLFECTECTHYNCTNLMDMGKEVIKTTFDGCSTLFASVDNRIANNRGVFKLRFGVRLAESTRRVSARAHKGNWQPQRNRNFREMSTISSRQLVTRLAGAY
jgi:hypothetical protein